jgi:membrane-bound lytic murein transglycosylase A
LAREARTDVRRLKPVIAVLCISAVGLVMMPLVVLATQRWRSHPPSTSHPAVRALPYPKVDLPPEIDGSQYFPVSWSDIPGWNDDDQLAAYRTFRASCKPITAQRDAPPDSRALATTLREPCRAARATEISNGAKARAFFEEHFVPLEISRLGQDAGFVTGYYEPMIEGSRTRNEVYNVPVYRRPSNLFMRGYSQASPDLPNKGQVFRKIGRRKLVPYYDRGEIEDGVLEGRGIEICWLKDQTDLLFAQIQGSARVQLPDGSTLRINYDSYNGYPYTAVGRVLVDRGIFTREEMSMQKIREWMEANPEGAKDVRRQNRSYVFFRELSLGDKDEAVGAQGIPLTPGRSIAVDKALHVYGTPFFISGELPIESEKSRTPFHRLMIAQDTGSAIVGPARADLYFGAGPDAGKIAGRLKSNVRFVMLVPKNLDPVARGRKLPLPDARPSAQIAKLYPQTAPSNDQPVDRKTAASSGPAPANAQVPLPAERPKNAPAPTVQHGREPRRSLHP